MQGSLTNVCSHIAMQPAPWNRNNYSEFSAKYILQLGKRFFSCSGFKIYKLRCFIKKGHQNMDFNSLNLSIHIYSDFIWSVFLMCNPIYCLSVHQVFRHVLPPLPDLTSLLSIKLTCMFCSLNLLYISWEKKKHVLNFLSPLFWSSQLRSIFLCCSECQKGVKKKEKKMQLKKPESI